MFKSFTFLFIIFSLYSQILSGYGRNKIQYENFEWLIIETKHFQVYYYKDMEDLAEKGAFYAEESYEYLRKEFNHTINRKIPIIFYSTHIHFQQTNITPGFIPEGVGGFFEFLKGRVVIPGNGNTNQFRKVIRHELTHVFMHTKIEWLQTTHNNSLVQAPLWFIEGLAEYFSSEWDYNGEMIMKDAVLNGYLPPIQQFYQIHGTYTMYKAGENILRFISKEYGHEKIVQIVDNIWKGKNFSDVIKYTIGEDYGSLNEKWYYNCKKTYFPMLQSYDFAFSKSKTIDKDNFNFKPLYNKKNNEIIFWSNRTGYAGIYKKSLKDLTDENPENEVEIILTGERSSDFEAFHVFQNRMDINDNILLFTSKSQSSDAIYQYDLDKGEIISKWQKPDQLVSITSPQFSPDGKNILFSGLEKTGYRNIFILHTDNDQLEKITDDFYEDNDPIYSRDGKTIYFSSDRTDQGIDWSYNIFSLNLLNKEINYITYGKHEDLNPSLSPDGKKIAYISTENNERNIYIVDVSSNEKKSQKITNFTSSIFDLDWVSNEKIIFSVFENNRFNLQELNIDTNDFVIKTQKNDLSKLYKANSWSIPGTERLKNSSKVSYESNYTLDFAQSQVSQDLIFGTTGGAYLEFTDVLGDDRFGLLIFNNASASDELLKSFNFRLTRLNASKRVNYSYGIYRFAGPRYDYTDYFQIDETGAEFALEYPFDQFQRAEFYTNVHYEYKNRLFSNYKAYVNALSVSYVFDNSLWGATGPIDGARYKIGLNYTKDFINNKVNFYTYILDLRHYFRVTDRSAFSSRFMTLVNKGEESRLFAMGGSWDMRGYRLLSLRGDHLMLFSNEYRFPFMDFLGFKISNGPAIGSNRVNGALFLDIGKVATSTFDNASTIGSYGFGMRFNMFGGFVLRYDIGRKTDFKNVDDDVFNEIFFGWDF